MLEGRCIVLVEDSEIMGASLLQRLELEQVHVQWFRRVDRAIPAIRTPRRPVDAVICDIRLPDGTGEELFTTLSRTCTPPPFLFITGQGGIDQAVRLIKAGAADYVTKPFEMGPFLERLALLMRPRSGLDLPPQTGMSPAARRVDREAHEAAGHDAPVVIRGEMGLGKARLARRIHLSSDRCSAPFVTVDAIGGTDSLSLLDRAIAEVGEGTLFVSGIGRLPEEGQARLALALRDGAFRLIATAGLRLEEKAAANGFRHDLLYALRAHEIVIPALADRTEDAVWLATQLFPGLNARRPAPLKGIAASAEAAMRTHDWPGNGREVRSRMVRAVEAADTDMILPSDLFPERAAQEQIRPLSEVRDDAERTQIVAALAHTSGQVTEAAKLLRVSRTTLWEKMQKLDL